MLDWLECQLPYSQAQHTRAMTSHFPLSLAHDRTLPLQAGSPALMGIINATPDSFSDGGQFIELDDQLTQARKLKAGGAVLLDIGGESTRPGAAAVGENEELRRVLPIIGALAVEMPDMLLSIDTSKAAVADRAIRAGAHLINDVSGGRTEPAIMEVAAKHRAGFCIMHMQGTPRTMQDAPQYKDVLREVFDFFVERVHAADAIGVARSCMMLDPGIGFGKTLDHNVALINGLGAFAPLGLPILLGVSRKSFLARLAPDSGAASSPARDALSQLAHVAGMRAGAAMLRVHDAALARDAMLVARGLGWG